MAQQLVFSDRIKAVVIPTSTQVLAALVVSLALITASQSEMLLTKLGITGFALDTTKNQFHDRLEVILRSPIASNLALLTFWATVGLVAYLICWGAYNALIEARNEVTLTTSYTNRGHQWRGPFGTLALKAASAVGLALILLSLRYGISFWLALSSQVVTDTTVINVISTIFAVVGLAVQLYLVLVFIQLTFTPWYRVKTFTDI